ncbi:unnamed protein product [Dovyalis caffra]|uniref:NAC domain-containing protein n=1 Tax=Dovyalis caffra TaxID=77055 RepID=A0AAV1S001_9ROSI|nr:unnamed protein product [Dovyalis caffra]
MRLDDWVLCRVRQKNSIPRNTWEDQNIPSCAPTSFFPKVHELLQTNTNPNIEMVRNYFSNDCPMLPYIFSPQDFPCSGRPSSINVPSSDESCSFDNLLIPQERKHVERNQQREIYYQQSKKLRTKADVEEDAISIRNDGTDENFCGIDQSQGGNFSAEQWNSLVQYQEFNHLAFTGNDKISKHR